LSTVVNNYFEQVNHDDDDDVSLKNTEMQKSAVVKEKHYIETRTGVLLVLELDDEYKSIKTQLAIKEISS